MFSYMNDTRRVKRGIASNVPCGPRAPAAQLQARPRIVHISKNTPDQAFSVCVTGRIYLPTTPEVGQKVEVTLRDDS